ncbi:MAG: hypothetical protein AB1938_24510 [Myxococcota bacterium]
MLLPRPLLPPPRPAPRHALSIEPVPLSSEKASALADAGVATVTLAPGLVFALARDSRLLTRAELVAQGRRPEDALAEAFADARLTAGALGLAPLGLHDAPVLTNHTHHPHAAAALGDLPLLRALRAAAGKNLLLAAPSPSRVFVALDLPRLDAALARLVAAASRLEARLLSPFVYRFDGLKLSLATASVC